MSDQKSEEPLEERYYVQELAQEAGFRIDGYNTEGHFFFLRLQKP